MFKLIKKIRKTKLSKQEIISDSLLLGVSAIFSLLIVFLFDIHHSFYSWPIFPIKFIFTSFQPYLIFTLSGAIVGFILLKIIALAILEEMK